MVIIKFDGNTRKLPIWKIISWAKINANQSPKSGLNTLNLFSEFKRLKHAARVAIASGLHSFQFFAKLELILHFQKRFHSPENYASEVILTTYK